MLATIWEREEPLQYTMFVLAEFIVIDEVGGL